MASFPKFELYRHYFLGTDAAIKRVAYVSYNKTNNTVCIKDGKKALLAITLGPKGKKQTKHRYFQVQNLKEVERFINQLVFGGENVKKRISSEGWEDIVAVETIYTWVLFTVDK